MVESCYKRERMRREGAYVVVGKKVEDKGSIHSVSLKAHKFGVLF